MSFQYDREVQMYSMRWDVYIQNSLDGDTDSRGIKCMFTEVLAIAWIAFFRESNKRSAFWEITLLEQAWKQEEKWLDGFTKLK